MNPGKIAALLLSTSLGQVVMPAFAQGDQPADASGDFAASDEILVVATRREQPLQDVPLAVTAVNEDTLRLNQINSIADIGSFTPNLITVAGTAGGSKSAPMFSIRGQSQQERGGLAESSVGVYFGDVAISRTQGLNQSLYDIQAVEVIRGPTGTLFGKNATGGAVIIRPNLPTTDGIEAGAGATFAEFGTANFDGYLNIPLSDKFAIRIGGASNNSDGYIYDESLGRNVDKDKTWSGRASVLFAPTDSIQNVTMVNHFEEDDGGSGGHAVFLNPAGFVSTIAAFRNYRPISDLISEQQARGDTRIANGVPEFNIVETTDVQNTTTIDLSENVTLKNIFGWRKVDSHILVDLDGTEHPLLHTEILDDGKQISNELQLFGGAGALDWIVGGYFFSEKGDNNAASVILGTESATIENSTNFVTGATNNHQAFDNKSYALFGEITLDMSSLLDGLSATAGGRHTWDKRKGTILNNRYNTSCAFTVDDDGDPSTPEVAPGFGPNCIVNAAADFSAFTYNFGLNYKPFNDTLLYASIRRGFRSGGFSARATTEEGLKRPFEPEFVRTIEMGLKKDWNLGGMFVQTNVAAFTSKYSNVQRQAVDVTSTSPFTVVVNAAESTIKGVEVETVVRPFDVFELSGFWGYTDAEFDTYIDPFTGNDLSGSVFARVPKNTWRLSSRLDLIESQNIGNVTFNAAYWGRDGYLAIDNALAPYDKIPAHQQLDLFLQFNEVANSGFDLALFARNVTDNIEYQPLASVWPSLGFAARVPGQPRQFGVQLRYDFSGDR